MNTPGKNFSICIDNSGYETSLIQRKLYEVIPDERAAQDDLVRIIDESGEDYLHHRSHFLIIELPIEIENILSTA